MMRFRTSDPSHDTITCVSPTASISNFIGPRMRARSRRSSSGVGDGCGVAGGGGAIVFWATGFGTGLTGASITSGPADPARAGAAGADSVPTNGVPADPAPAAARPGDVDGVGRCAPAAIPPMVRGDCEVTSGGTADVSPAPPGTIAPPYP